MLHLILSMFITTLGMGLVIAQTATLIYLGYQHFWLKMPTEEIPYFQLKLTLVIVGAPVCNLLYELSAYISALATI